MSFSIGSKGYIGTGIIDSNGNLSNDFWEWNQLTNTWYQKAILLSVSRFGAIGFSIGTKVYIGTGNSGNENSNLKDFWEWDQTTDTWNQKNDFGGTHRRYAVGFSIGTKGYLGTGWNGNNLCKDFWQWNQATDTWLQKNDFGGVARTHAEGFSISEKGYLGIGDDITVNYNDGLKNDFWEYNPSNDSWTQRANFAGTGRGGVIGFSIGCKGYIGTGLDAFDPIKSDFWEYTPSINTCLFTIHSKFLIEGFYIGNGMMTPVIDPANYPNLCDTIILQLHSQIAPYQELYSDKKVFHTDGTCDFIFSTTPDYNSYYLVLRHRNSMETWSKFPVPINGSEINFDFTRE